MKEYTEKELMQKAEAYCAAAERCPSDVEGKLKGWGAVAEVGARIMAHLLEERYLDTVRFCRFFVRDKYRFNHWGRMKIIQALRMKHLSEKEIETGLEEIDPEEYDGILKNLLEKKAKEVKAASGYERNAKLLRFAAGRGFTMDEIMKHLTLAETDEHME